MSVWLRPAEAKATSSYTLPKDRWHTSHLWYVWGKYFRLFILEIGCFCSIFFHIGRPVGKQWSCSRVAVEWHVLTNRNNDKMFTVVCWVTLWWRVYYISVLLKSKSIIINISSSPSLAHSVFFSINVSSPPPPSCGAILKCLTLRISGGIFIIFVLSVEHYSFNRCE